MNGTQQIEGVRIAMHWSSGFGCKRMELELRLDTFNTLNHTQFDGINSTLNVTSLTNQTPTNLASEIGNGTGFGAVTSVRPPRSMQISARLQF